MRYTNPRLLYLLYYRPLSQINLSYSNTKTKHVHIRIKQTIISGTE